MRKIYLLLMLAFVSCMQEMQEQRNQPSLLTGKNFHGKTVTGSVSIMMPPVFRTLFWYTTESHR